MKNSSLRTDTNCNLIPQPTEVYYSGDYDKKSDPYSASHPDPSCLQYGTIVVIGGLWVKCLLSRLDVLNYRVWQKIMKKCSFFPVKRKYTKRKGVTKPVVPTPRKRFKSTPTPPVASPVANIPSPLSAGPIVSVAGRLGNRPKLITSFCYN